MLSPSLTMGPGKVGRPVLGASLSAYSKPGVFLMRRTREQDHRCDGPLQDKPTIDSIAVANALLVSETQHERGIAPSTPRRNDASSAGALEQA